MDLCAAAPVDAAAAPIGDRVSGYGLDGGIPCWPPELEPDWLEDAAAGTLELNHDAAAFGTELAAFGGSPCWPLALELGQLDVAAARA